MPFSATVYQVVIASPSDTTAEVKQAKRAILDWNEEFGFDRKIFLFPLHWETHTAPVQGVRAQATVNKQMIEDADVVVAIFNMRLGSPTGESISGTVEEIEKHTAAGKLTMVYFASGDIPRRHDDEQLAALEKFRDENRRLGYAFDYRSPRHFAQLLKRHLRFHARNDFRPPHATTPLTAPQPDQDWQTALSPMALSLLKTAIDVGFFQMSVIHEDYGLFVHIWQIKFGKRDDGEEDAKLRLALNELTSASLIVAQQSGRPGVEEYSVTPRGIEVRDQLPFAPKGLDIDGVPTGRERRQLFRLLEQAVDRAGRAWPQNDNDRLGDSFATLIQMFDKMQSSLLADELEKAIAAYDEPRGMTMQLSKGQCLSDIKEIVARMRTAVILKEPPK